MSALAEPEHLIIIGAQRSGTTYLYEVLDAHPQVLMARPLRPEPKYFLRDNISLAHYRNSLFPDIPAGIRILGEKSTSYYEFPEVAGRIQAIMPDAKLVFVMRDPVERALSNYFFSLQNGLESRTLEEVFLFGVSPPEVQVKTSVDPFDYLGRGDYEALIKPFHIAFGKQLKLILFDRLVDGSILDDLFRFLGVEGGPSMKGSKGANEAGRFEVPGEVRDFLRSWYRPKTDALENYLKMDLSHWKKP